jgi:hypothetical protein
MGAASAARRAPYGGRCGASTDRMLAHTSCSFAAVIDRPEADECNQAEALARLGEATAGLREPLVVVGSIHVVAEALGRRFGSG